MATLEAKIAFDTTAEAELGSLNMNGRRGTVSVVSSQAGTLKVYWSPGLSARIELASEATSVASSLNYKIIDLDQCLLNIEATFTPDAASSGDWVVVEGAAY